MKKIICLILVFVCLLSAVSVNAGFSVYPDGKITNTVVFHNGSGWYIKNDKWVLDESGICEFDENGRVYVPVSFLKKTLGFFDAYCTVDGKNVYAEYDKVKIWQVIGHESVCVNDVWYDDAAAYAKGDGSVMVPLDVYTYPAGYSITIEYPDSYPEGIVTLSKSCAMNYSRVHVNKTMQMVTVYGVGPDKREIPVWHAVCSTGMPGQETPHGRFYIKPLSMGADSGKWYLFASSGTWIVNCCQLWGDYCFHSILFSRKFTPSSLNYESYYDLGEKATNGCVRLTVGDSAFIYDNCGGLPCDIDGGFYSDELALIKQQLLDSLPETAEEYVKAIS